jgi:hypothetical protein
VELALKYVLFYSRWLEDHAKNADDVVMFKKTHGLNWLWERIKAEMPAKLGDDTWDGFATDFIGKLVRTCTRQTPGHAASDTTARPSAYNRRESMMRL